MDDYLEAMKEGRIDDSDGRKEKLCSEAVRLTVRALIIRIPLSSPSTRRRPRTTTRSSLRHKSLVCISLLATPLSLFANFYEYPNAERTVDSYPLVVQIHSRIYTIPPIRQPVTHLEDNGGSEALWLKMASGLPHVSPKVLRANAIEVPSTIQ